MRIEQLSAVVANQIAAGEVIERPASVVKELLENSLDAQADSIHIEVDFGGLNLIKISDNGIGIVADDLRLATAAHATSKIRQLNDLYQISSMGFRGEALASIASVSRLVISSKPEAQAHAMMICVEGAEVSLLPCARAQGTTVEVHDLFFNAPVRKKFLKTERTEYQAIEAVVRRFALSAPAMGFSLKHNGKPMLVLPAAICEKTRLARIRKLFGKTFLEQAVYLDVERAGMRLQGWVGGPDYQRSQNDKQWVYINQRMVKDKLINHAIKQAYEGVLNPGRNPACLLYLTMPGQELDVNVHPTKHEVRFQQPRLVHDFITSQILQALATPIVTSTQPVNEKTAQCIGIRETYIAKPLSAMLPGVEPMHQPWVILNMHFALIFIQEQPYLVDVQQLAHERLSFVLNQQPRPLKSRALLVPVSYPLESTASHLVEQYQLKLNELGVELDLISETKIMVRSIPLLLPQVDIKQLLARLSKQRSLEQAALLTLLIDCQSLDAYQLTLDEQQELTHYLHQQLTQPRVSKPCYLSLDVKQCRAILPGELNV